MGNGREGTLAGKRSYQQRDEEQLRYQELNQHLKEGKFSPIYLLYGSENYLKRSYLRLFREKFGGKDGMNYSYFEGNADLDTLISALDTMPFFAEKRLVVWKDSELLRRTAPERLCTYLEQLPDTSCLMLIEEAADKRNRLYKLVEKRGFVCELAEQDVRMLSGWAARYLMKAGKKVRSSTMERLIERSGRSMDRLSGELEKLIAYTGEREIVEDEDVGQICTANVEDRVFDMITELSLGNTERAMRHYSDLLTLQEAPMKILALLRRSFNQLLLTKECVRQGMARNDAAKYIGVSPWAVPKLMEQAKHYTMESLQGYLSRCLFYDEGIKNGNLRDRMAVELLLTS